MQSKDVTKLDLEALGGIQCTPCGEVVSDPVDEAHPSTIPKVVREVLIEV